jgi:uncharacterized protein YegP (UPF0339 family)
VEIVKPRKQIEVYESRRGGHYWRMRDKNGKIVADGSEAYATPSNARRAARAVARAMLFAPIVTVEWKA